MPRPIAGCRRSSPPAKARGGADLLFVGRIVPSKGQHELVKALWAYRRLYDPAARLHLVGGSSSFAYLKALRGFIAELGLADAVRITGDVSDAALAAYFAAADVYLSLSAHEGFGVPLVEAMAAGVPVVARRVGAVAETVGDAALVLAGTDPSYVAAAVHRVRTDVDATRAVGRRRDSAACRRSVSTPWPRSWWRPSPRWPGRPDEGRFVTPRYGPQVMGGAETAARQLAEHLLVETGWEAEAYSTCALDPHTWADELEPGTSEINGVPVHRFASAHGRLAAFYGLDGRLRLAPQRASRDEGRRWVDYNGPVSPDLIDAVIAADADVVAFYPYLYHPTVAAIGKVQVPAVLHPAAHDEPALYLPVFRGTFGDADAFCFHTAAERLLVERTYPVAEKPQIVLGLGVGESAGAGRPGGDVLGLGDRPYIVSVGRVDEHKGSKMLAAYFAEYKERHPGPLALALVGPISVELDPHPDIVITGAVDEADKWDIVRDAQVAVSPSALESFSLVVLEAWVDRVPVVVNGACGPTREHCERSGGGLWFTSYREFEGALDRLLGDPVLRTTLGRGRPGLRRSFLSVARVDRALRRLPDVGRGAGPGHTGAALRGGVPRRSG